MARARRIELRNILAAGRDLAFLVRNDREVRASVRTMILTVAVALLAYHTAVQYLVAPMRRELERIRAETAEAETEAGALAAGVKDAALLEQMQKRKRKIEEECAVLATEIRYRREHWRACGDTAAFNRVIFTTGRGAPFRFARSLSEMSRAKPRSAGPFLLHPVRIGGTAPYRDLAAYLAFLEARPEVGGIEAMTLQRAKDGRVDFSLTVTRRELAEGKE